MITIYQKLQPNIWFKTGTADKLRKIDICKLFYTLGERHSLALLGFHVFTGSDVSGKFAWRSKEFCFKTFLSCNDDILIALENLGNILREDVFNNLEKFVCFLYRNKKYSNIYDLRWFLYSNREGQAESLPLTKSALELHTMRAHYISMIWKCSFESVMCLPSIEDFGWEKDNQGFISPLHCRIPPAPESVINLIKCGCGTGCSRNCSCRKNRIACTELCTCFQSSCNNPHNKIDDDAFIDTDEII